MSNYKFPILFLIVFVLGISNIFAQTVKGDVNRPVLSLDDQRKFDYYFYNAMNSKSIEKYGATYDFLQYCMKIDSTNASVLFELGNFFNSIQNKDQAYAYYQRAVGYDSDNFYYNMALASALAERQDYKDAASVYQKLINQNPLKIELYMYLSEVYRLDGDLLNSIQALNDLERTMGMNEKITIQKFKLYSALNDKKKAYAEVQKYIDKYPDDIRYYILLANLYLQEGKNKEAYASLSKAKSIDPEDPYLITSMANYYQTVGDQPKAEAELRAALFSSKTDIDTKIGILSQYIGILQQGQQDLEPAYLLLDSLMVEHPQEAKFNLLYGNLLMLQDRKKEANFQYRVYAESDPTNPVGWEQLLQSTDVDSIDALIDVCKSAIVYLPEEPLFYFYLSVGQYQKKEFKEALKTLEDGIVFAQDNPRLLSEFYGQKGSIYYELKQQDSAFVEFDQSLKYNPQNLGVLNNYSYYLSLAHKDLDRAENMSSITIKAEPTNPTYLDTYGWILFMQGAYTTAKIYLENAVKYSEEKEKEISAEVLEHYGDVLYMMDDKENAVIYWERAKEKGSESKTLDQKIKTKTFIAPNSLK
ncbi:tetratricopeptide repeat protein [Dysgonomonas alginatilytica]|uniref:Tetratricopeptide repeat protein n=1 Tax=Dysgonomonas alginatilytica TaxID=1605892 RepID=A0A2V3PSE5_9BACT|nr:tetratricopeptide repeat protein [Dysgonomonas alginatilytica]PXV65441.1 tetratricopeptide repeat protein [Dysgonomonas alginatilytica]